MLPTSQQDGGGLSSEAENRRAETHRSPGCCCHAEDKRPEHGPQTSELLVNYDEP
ncbi:hypothetical protein P7K49_030055, partial [Saguinus oedipus]